jgi:hypothetical protein
VTVCPFATWKPIVGNHGGAMAGHLGLILHVQQGNNSLSGWFNNPAAGASSTWWVSKSGALEQYVDADVEAWAQGAGNATYNSVETEGYVEEPLTDAAEAMLARLYAWGADTYAWADRLAEAPGAHGFGWHGMGGAAWGGHVACPGDLRKDRRQPILDTAFASSAPTPPELPEVSDMIAPPCVFNMDDGSQQVFYVDGGGRLRHHYWQAGRAWVGESLSAGWDPDSGLAAARNDQGTWQVWGVLADGDNVQCYWSGRAWVTQPL